MKKLTFGIPELHTPTQYCKTLQYTETAISYPVDTIRFEVTSQGCVLHLPMAQEEHIYGLGLQLKAFDLRGKKMQIRPNADPIAPTGDSHAPVPFFVSTKGYGIYVDTARYASFYFGSSRRLTAAKTAANQKEIAVSTDALYAADAVIDA